MKYNRYNWLAPAVWVLSGYGLVRLMRNALSIPGCLHLDAQGIIQTLVLSRAHPLATKLLLALQQLFAPQQTAVCLGEIEVSHTPAVTIRLSAKNIRIVTRKCGGNRGCCGEIAGMSTRATQIDSLTPLRGIAAMLVVVYHTDSLLRAQHMGRLVYGTGFLARGYLWVDFFFVLSGFIITHVYGQRFTQGITRATTRDYVLARFARIYPLYLFALCFSVAVYLTILLHSPGTASFYAWKTLPLHLLMLLSFNVTPMGWNVPAWSIGAEWWTYLLALPLFPLLNRSVSKRTFLLPLLCAVGLGALVTLHPRHALDITFDCGLLRCLLDFPIGICVYQLYRARLGARLLSTDRAFAVAALLTVAVLHFAAPGDVPAGKGSFFPTPHPLTALMDAISPLVFGGLILCAALNVTRGRRLLNTRPLQYLGNISYSVYIMQGTGLMVFYIGCGIWRRHHPTGTLDTPTMLAIVGTVVVVDLLLAAATYRWVEIPSRAWLRRKLIPQSS